MKKPLIPREKSVALLLDPDKAKESALDRILVIAEENRVDYILAGGSITFNSMEKLVTEIRKNCSVPVILFPGNLLQLTTKVNGVYFISLISGRNPELLIGNHVLAAPFLKDMRNRVVPVGYMLINCGSKTSVEYLSQTAAIPCAKTDIIIATALAGEMLGMKMIYLEGGSGSKEPVPGNVIRAVKDNLSVPVAVGGGLTDATRVSEAFKSGADLVVVGNGCEKRPSLLAEACKVRDSFRK